MKYNYFGLTSLGKVRKNNEDFFGHSETLNGDVYVVCDGMGGHAGGEVASSKATTSVIKHLQSKKYSNPVIAIYEAIQFANKEILAEADNNPHLSGMGTTITLALIRNEEVYIAHVGDSRIYLVSDKKLHHLTVDHSYVQKLVDEGIITPEQAEHHPKKNQLLQALGIKSNIDITISNQPIQLKAGDQLLLCTDGLTGMVNDPTINSVLSNNSLTIEEKSKELIKLSNNAGGVDNITLILLEIVNSKYTTTVFVKNDKAASNIHRNKESRKVILNTVLISLAILFGVAAFFFYKSNLYRLPTDKILSLVINSEVSDSKPVKIVTDKNGNDISNQTTQVEPAIREEKNTPVKIDNASNHPKKAELINNKKKKNHQRELVTGHSAKTTGNKAKLKKQRTTLQKEKQEKKTKEQLKKNNTKTTIHENKVPAALNTESKKTINAMKGSPAGNDTVLHNTHKESETKTVKTTDNLQKNSSYLNKTAKNMESSAIPPNYYIKIVIPAENSQNGIKKLTSKFHLNKSLPSRLSQEYGICKQIIIYAAKKSKTNAYNFKKNKLVSGRTIYIPRKFSWKYNKHYIYDKYNTKKSGCEKAFQDFLREISKHN